MPNAGPTTRAGRFPWSGLAGRSGGPNNLSRVHNPSMQQFVRDQLEMDSHVEPRSNTALQVTAPTTQSTTAEHRVDYTAGACRVGGIFERFAVAADQTLVSAGAPDIESYDLAGAAAVAISGDNLDVVAVIVAIVVAGAVELRGVFGAEAATGTAVEPTAAQIDAALRAASITDHQPEAFLVLGVVTFARGVGTVTDTAEDPATNDDLADERGRGYAYPNP